MAEILVVGLSARALSSAARRAGYAPLAADLFGDDDLREIAEESARIGGDLERGLEREPLLDALDGLASGRQPIGVLCGSGFEDRPHLLDELGERWPLIGNGGGAVARAKDPKGLADVCRRLDLPHPRWSDTRRDGWLCKRRGGSGGNHVFPPSSLETGEEPGAAAVAVAPRSSQYWHEPVQGEPVSALVLADGDEAIVLGFSAQWTDPTPGAPYRYGGAVRPATIPQRTETTLDDAARRVVKALGLVGLNSVDFLVDETDWRLIEVNPRPGATLDVFEPDGDALVTLHVEACRGRLPERSPRFSDAAAAAVVYARRDVARVPKVAWPDWAADRQPAETCVPAGAPLCTVLAHAGEAGEARRLAIERATAMRALLGAD
jgi:predicted ATP-grasp superfamily ATP-dependent carboligase